MQGKEPSWPVQKLILELLPIHGNRPTVIQRSLDIQIREMELMEDTPGIEWIKKIIARLQKLPISALVQLSPSVWKWRNDYNSIRGQLERGARENEAQPCPEAFSGDEYESVLIQRKNYVDKKLAEIEGHTRANIMQIRHEAGLPLVYYTSNGLEF